MIGTKAGDEFVSAGIGRRPARASRRQAYTCCGQTCQRRATAEAFVSGANASHNPGRVLGRPAATALGAGQTSMRRPGSFVSSLASNTNPAQSQQTNQDQAQSGQRWNTGHRAALTTKRIGNVQYNPRCLGSVFFSITLGNLGRKSDDLDSMHVGELGLTQFSRYAIVSQDKASISYLLIRRTRCASCPNFKTWLKSRKRRQRP